MNRVCLFFIGEAAITEITFCAKSITPSASPVLSAAPSMSPLGSISGNVNEDVDNDDIGETNLPNVVISLILNSSGQNIATTATDSQGNYLFVDLPVGLYRVTEFDLPGFVSVTDVDGVNDNSILVSLTFTNLNSTENNFIDERSIVPSSQPSASPSSAPSVPLLGSISGNVKEDTDNDDIGEVNLSSVLITLLDSGSSPVATTVTDSGGNYLFVDLPVGLYSVRETDLPGFSSVIDVDGLNGNTVGVSLTFSNLNSTENNFVDERPGVPASSQPSISSSPSAAPLLGSISGNVKEDVDDDNTGEIAIPLVLVSLLDRSGTTVATTLTDNEGNYIFVDLPLGPYSVTERDLAGFISVNDVDGNNDNTIAVVLTSTNLNSTENNFVDERISTAPSSVPSNSPSVSISPSTTPSISCTGETVTIDFDSDENGSVLARGAYVSDQWLSKFGVNITALATIGGFTDGGRARIFDTSLPGVDQSVGDPDLGSPNR